MTKSKSATGMVSVIDLVWTVTDITPSASPLMDEIMTTCGPVPQPPPTPLQQQR